MPIQVGTEGKRDCSEVYPKCLLQFEDMRLILKRQGEGERVGMKTKMFVPGITFDIPGRDRDCQIYFLWKAKNHENSTSEEENIEPKD